MVQAEDPARVQSDDELLRPKEAAQELNLSHWTLKDWREKDEGPPFIRHGRFIRYRRGSLRAWVAAREVAPDNRAEALA